MTYVIINVLVISVFVSPQVGGTVEFVALDLGGTKFGIAVTEVSVSQFRKFTAATNYSTTREKEGDKNSAKPIQRGVKGRITWKNPGFEQGELHPVVWVTQADANAYCEWLSKNNEQFNYRLPTKAEWMSASEKRLVDYPDEEKKSEFINISDRSLNAVLSSAPQSLLDDNFPYTAPVNSKRKGLSGLRNLHGNVAELCQCERPDRSGVAGGSWFEPEFQLKYSYEVPQSFSNFALGFRIVRTTK